METQRPESEHIPSSQKSDHGPDPPGAPVSKDDDKDANESASGGSGELSTQCNTPTSDKSGASSASSSPKRKAEEPEAEGSMTRSCKRRTVTP